MTAFYIDTDMQSSQKFLYAKKISSSIHHVYNTQPFLNEEQLTFHACSQYSSHTAVCPKINGSTEQKLYIHNWNELNLKRIRILNTEYFNLLKLQQNSYFHTKHH